MKGIVTQVLFLLIAVNVCAQPEGISWQQTLGASETEYFGGIAMRQDGGYFVCGYSNSVDGPFTGNQGNWDMFVATLSPLGEVENIVTVGSSGYDQCNDLIALENGGVAVIGRAGESDGDITTGNNGSSDVWIGVFNTDLELTAQYGFGGNSLDEGEAIIQTSDGGYLLTGRTSSTNGMFDGALGFDDAFLLKLMPDFSLDWLGRYGGSDWDVPHNLIETEDGYIVVGSSESSDNDLEANQGADDAWVFKVDLEGNVLWSTSFGGSFYDSIFSIAPDIDGNYVLVGTSKYEDDDVIGVNSRFGLIAKMTPEGDVISQMDVGTQADDELADVIVKPDGTRVCLGITNGSFSLGGIGGSDYYLLEVDPSDNVTWEQVYGGSMGDGGYQLLQDGDGYVLAGQHVGDDGNITQAYGSFDVSVLRVGEAMVIAGCTDELACNYAPDASEDDGSCFFVGDPCDDGDTETVNDVIQSDCSCSGEIEAVSGCTDPQACNYDDAATEDDGSCDYVDTFSIAGNGMPDLGSSEVYTYPATAGSTYEWTVTSGTIVEGQGSAELTIEWTAEGSSQLCVTETREDGCSGEEVCENIVVLPTDIEEQEGEAIVVYPNPASVNVTVSVPSSWLTGEYEVVDLQGRAVLQGTVNRAPIVLDVSGLTSGRYELVIRHDVKLVSHPLVIQK